MGLIDGLLAPPGGFRAFVKRQVTLPREVARELTSKVPGAREHSTFGHGSRVLGRYALALIGLLRLP